jgi:hypothetical protein
MESYASRRLTSRLEKLAQLVQGLYAGKVLHINRLTVIKFLCEDWEAAIHFSLHLAKMTQERIQNPGYSNMTGNSLSPEYKDILKEAMHQITRYVAMLNDPDARVRCAKLTEKFQKTSEWGILRKPQDNDRLIIEQAICCILYPSSSSYYGYEMAKAYAGFQHKHSDQRLQPEAAPQIEQMGDFWCQHYFGKRLREWAA